MKMHNHVVLDTNVILRYLLRDHEEMFQTSNEVFENIRKGTQKAELLDCVLAECVYVLTKFYRVSRAETADKLQMLLLYKGISNSNRQTMLDALALYRSENVNIVDCLVHQTAKDGKLSVFSFDLDLTRKLRDK